MRGRLFHSWHATNIQWPSGFPQRHAINQAINATQFGTTSLWAFETWLENVRHSHPLPYTTHPSLLSDETLSCGVGTPQLIEGQSKSVTGAGRRESEVRRGQGRSLRIYSGSDFRTRAGPASVHGQLCCQWTGRTAMNSGQWLTDKICKAPGRRYRLCPTTNLVNEGDGVSYILFQWVHCCP